VCVCVCVFFFWYEPNQVVPYKGPVSHTRIIFFSDCIDVQYLLHRFFYVIYIHCVVDCFIALTLLVGRQEEHLACKNRVRRGAIDFHMVRLMPLSLRHLLLH